MRILLIEDDLETAAFVSRGLEESGHIVDHVSDGSDGLAHASEEIYDVLIVDRMLPGMAGLEIITALRAKNVTVPVLVLSALGEIDDRVAGFHSGGDDYLVKPFAFSELLARVEALARRNHQARPDAKLTVSDLELDRLKRTVHRAGRSLSLQPREFRLLEYLMLNSPNVVTRTMLLENVWNYHFDPQTNVIDVHISRLRSKLDREFDRPLLQTIRGAGYCIREQD